MECVEALGGRLHLAAVFPEQTIGLAGAGEESGVEGQRSEVGEDRGAAPPGEARRSVGGSSGSEAHEAACAERMRPTVGGAGQASTARRE